MEKVKVIIGCHEVEVECAQDSITYENGGYVVNMNKFKGEQLIKHKDYDDYVAFIISDQIGSTCYDKLDWTCDEVWVHCVELAKEFEVSELNIYEKALYECVIDYVDHLKKEGRIYE